MAEKFNVIHQAGQRRFEIQAEGHTAALEYEHELGALVFTHTRVPPELEGRGIGSQLAKAGLDYARAQKLKVKPLCWFIAGYIERHPEYAELIG